MSKFDNDSGPFNDSLNKYKDIINLPHPVSAKHNKMSLYDRAAQFSPFAALTGFENATSEEARLTSEQKILDENALAEINKRLLRLEENLSQKPLIAITFFKADDKKAGGSYITLNTTIKKIDHYNKLLVTDDAVSIPINNISRLDGNIFNDLDFI